jgi:hypothetical protein
MLFFCEEGKKKKLIEIFDTKMVVPFQICEEGSKIVYEEEKNYGIL